MTDQIGGAVRVGSYYSKEGAENSSWEGFMASVYRKNCNRIKADFDIRGICRDMVCHLHRSFFISHL